MTTILGLKTYSKGEYFMEISVYNEWGKLRSVMLGIEDNTTEPGYIDALKWVSKEGIASIKKHAGSVLAKTWPENAKAISDQINGLAETLKNLGVEVHRTKKMKYPEEINYLADIQPGVHVWGGADFFRVIGKRIILLNALRYPFRRKQALVVRHALEPLLKDADNEYVAAPTPSPHYSADDLFLENGDIMLDGYNVYAGYSGNGSSLAGIEWLRRYLGSAYKVYLVKLSPKLLHLDTVLMLNRPGLLTWYPEFVEELPLPLRHWDKIEVTQKNEEEPLFGANSLVVDEKKIIISDIYARLISEYEKRGFDEVISLPFSMTIAYGAGPRCLTGVLRRDS
jgi:N-dimethylarginine dimethylaminohydrolase